jgi:hypothetical protein
VLVRNAKKSGRQRRVAVLAAAGVALGLAVAAAPDAAAATRSCDFSVTTNKYSCGGSGQVRGEHDVIGAKLFTGRDFGGSSLTVWVPKPCVKNGKVDHFVKLGSEMKDQISSVQGWSSCWVWLYRADGNREGPYQGNNSDVGSDIEDQTTTVGLS